MPSRVLLINANRCQVPDPVFPIGLAFLNGALRRAGHETRWVDFSIDRLETLRGAIQDFSPAYLGVSFRNIDNVLDGRHIRYSAELAEVCGLLRKMTECPIIVGGSGFSIFPKQLLEMSGADFGISGEGERPMVQLLGCLETGDDPAEERIPGLVFRRGSEVVVNPQEADGFGACLEMADFPPRSVEYYLRAGGMMNLQTQRGCPFNCCYCTYPLLEGRRSRRRAGAEVAAEMETMSRLGARYVFIVDSVFNSSHAHVVETCEAILSRGVKIKWGCFLRPQGLTEDLMGLMARAGLQHVEFGSDSFCDEVLAAYGKNLRFDEILQSSELACRAQLAYCHFLICGGPGETRDTLRRTFENSKRTGGVIMAVAGMRVYPGTPLAGRVRDESHGGNADLLAPMYYVAPPFTAETLSAEIDGFAARSSNWIPAKTPPAYTAMVARLRKRGVTGPLWSYFAVTQGLWPHP